MILELGPRQKVLVATAATVLAMAVILLAVGTMLWLAGLFVRAFSHVLLPLALAGIVALVCQPYFVWLRRRARLPVPLAVVAVILSFVLPLCGVSWLFGAALAGQVGELVRQLPGWWDDARAVVERRLPQVVEFFQDDPLGQRIRAAAESRQEQMLSGLQSVGGHALSAGAGVLRGIGSLFSWAVTPVYFVFFLAAGGVGVDRLERVLPFLKPQTRSDVVFLVREFVDILVAFFRGQILVALAQGALFAVGFALVGLKYGFVLGLTLGFLNVIPYLGSLFGLAIALPLALFQQGGGWSAVAWVLAVFVGVQLIEGYVLTPRIMGERTGLHPMAIIVAVFFWGTALDGILGMILAIPLTAFLVVFWRLAREKYIAEWV